MHTFYFNILSKLKKCRFYLSNALRFNQNRTTRWILKIQKSKKATHFSDYLGFYSLAQTFNILYPSTSFRTAFLKAMQLVQYTIRWSNLQVLPVCERNEECVMAWPLIYVLWYTFYNVNAQKSDSMIKHEVRLSSV